MSQRVIFYLFPVLFMLLFSGSSALANEQPQHKQIRLCDGRVLVSIPTTWKTKELPHWQTVVLSPDMMGVAVIFNTYFDPKEPGPATGAKIVRDWASKAGSSLIEQESKVYYSKNEPYDVDGEKGMIYGWIVSVDRAVVKIQIRMPDRWRTHEKGKLLLTEHVTEIIKTLHLDRPKGDTAVDTIKGEKTLKNDIIYQFDAKDPEMNAAAAKTQETLSEFRELFKKAKDTSSYIVKVKIVRGKYVEYMWAHQLKITDAGFEGVINNTPSRAEFPKLGDAFTISNDDVYDWVYLKDKRAVGGFSIRIIQERLKAKENR